jgi:hypothetical protein
LESPFSQSRNVKFDQCPEAALAIVDVTLKETPFQSPLLSSYSVLQLSDGPGPMSSVTRFVPAGMLFQSVPELMSPVCVSVTSADAEHDAV